MGVRWEVASPLSARHVAERMEDRGVEGDHSTMPRWGIKDSPPLEIYQSCNLHKTLFWENIDSCVAKPPNKSRVSR